MNKWCCVTLGIAVLAFCGCGGSNVDGPAAGGSQPDFNSATATEIKTAAGRMTMTTAEAIVAARTAADGKFSNWAEVDRVRGVGELTLTKLQSAFTLEQAKDTAAEDMRPGAAATARPGRNSRSATAGGKLNLNTATLAQLETLPAMSATRAQAIIDARELLPGRRFQTWEQVDAAPGVGVSMLARLKESCVLK